MIHRYKKELIVLLAISISFLVLFILNIEIRPALYLIVYIINFFIIPKVVSKTTISLFKKTLFTVLIFVGSIFIILYTDGVGKAMSNYAIIFSLILIYSVSKLFIKRHH